jgi:hydroxyacylglutathione hydrolase
MALSVITIPCLSDNYAFILRCTDTGITAVVDAPEATPILAELKKQQWGLNLILITHHHSDHIAGIDELRAVTGAKVIGANLDKHRLPFLNTAVEEGDIISVGNSNAEVINTSGHTMGHISFVFNNDHKVFSGDSLMALGCGRIFEGTPEIMWDTLKKFIALPHNTMVYSGHEYTANNAKFALNIDPTNKLLVERAQNIETLRIEGKSTIPSMLELEMATNPFLRSSTPSFKVLFGMNSSSDLEVFTKVRTLKDNFKS